MAMILIMRVLQEGDVIGSRTLDMMIIMNNVMKLMKKMLSFADEFEIE